MQAAFQGQTAAATITQTNVLTAAEAAAGPGSGSAAGGTGLGGGLSNTAIAAIVGGAGAGAVGAALVLNKGAEPTASSTTYTGAYTGRILESFTSSFPTGTATCVHTRDIDGTLTMSLQQQSNGTISGAATTTKVETVVPVSAGCSPENMVIGARRTEPWTVPVTGTAQNLAFSGQQPFTAVPFSGGMVQVHGPSRSRVRLPAASCRER